MKLLIVKSTVHRGAIAIVPFALQDAQVRASKACVAEGVAHRVDSGVDVAKVIEEVP